MYASMTVNPGRVGGIYIKASILGGLGVAIPRFFDGVVGFHEILLYLTMCWKCLRILHSVKWLCCL